jgi:hypothetical protein
MYISAARSLLAGKGFAVFDGSPYVAWPPLFPALLAALGWLGVDPTVGAGWLNALTFGALIFASGHLFGRCLRSQALAVLGAASVACSMPLLDASKMAWTEPLFALWVVLFVIYLPEFLKRPRPFPFLGLCLLAAFACLQRYIGVTVILAGAGVILLSTPGAAFLRRCQYAAGFGLLSVAPVGAWMFRNYALTSTLTGNRSSAATPLGQNITSALDALTIWFLPHPIPFEARVAGLGLFACGAAWIALKAGWGGPTQTLSAGAFALVYILFLIAAATGVAFDSISDRLLAPVYVPLLLLAWVGMERMSTTLKDERWKNGLVAALCTLWLIYPLLRVTRNVAIYAEAGAGGYNTAAWRESPLLKWVLAHQNERIYTNAPDAVYILTGLTVQTSPVRNWDLKKFRESLTALEGRVYLVWFIGVSHSYTYHLYEFNSILNLSPVARFPDGEVYMMM